MTPEPEEIKQDTQQQKRIPESSKQKPKKPEKDTEELVEKDLAEVNSI